MNISSRVTICLLVMTIGLYGSNPVKISLPNTKKSDKARAISHQIAPITKEALLAKTASKASDIPTITQQVPKQSIVQPVAQQQGIYFAGLQENGVTKNTFLCQGPQFSGSTCKQDAINNAVGYDLMGGKTLQFFNNFSYWLKEKEKREQLVKVNFKYDGEALQNKMNQEGWAAIGGYSILVSTNEMLQKTAISNSKGVKGTVKVIAQLFYNGNNLMQLWSQDIVFVKPGQKIIVVVSNATDDQLAVDLTNAKKTEGVISYIEELGMQPQNRDESVYSLASDSPRMIRIQAS